MNSSARRVHVISTLTAPHKRFGDECLERAGVGSSFDRQHDDYLYIDLPQRV